MSVTTPASGVDQIRALVQAAEELRDAYVAFYGGDFDDPDETTESEREMIRQADAALAPFADPHRALVLTGEHREGSAARGAGPYCPHPDCVAERRDYDDRMREAQSIAADAHLEADYEDRQNGGE